MTSESTPSKSHASPKPPSPQTVERTQKEPAVERGERIEAGKQIARSGKEGGPVPGATSQRGNQGGASQPDAASESK